MSGLAHRIAPALTAVMMTAAVAQDSPAPATTTADSTTADSTTALYSSDFLPPLAPWSGTSDQYLAAATDPWITPAEQNGLTDSPDYATTVAWLQRLAAASPQVQLRTIGRSAQGRDIIMAIADRDGYDDPEAIQRSGRALVLVHGGIHAGEIDGKDAGLMLLRDLTVGGSASTLLEQASLMFIPILNVDGHERSSVYNRINQRGPSAMGWRTNARNLNLNRDYTKLETAGVRALASVVNLWQPDLYVDVHVTDGADYQYDVTYGWNGPHGWSPHIADWLDDVLRPAVNRQLTEHGHIPGPLIFAANGRDMSAGMLSWTATPRFSNGWGDARHLPTILVENHSLKPYRQRVLGTYVFLRNVLAITGQQRDALREATIKDRYAEHTELALDWRTGENPGTIRFKGIRSENYLSPISGGLEVRWLGEPEIQEIPLLVMDQPKTTVTRPRYYYIPAAWVTLANRLRDQGILVDEVQETVTAEVQRYRLPEAALDAANTPFEGRPRYTAGTPQVDTVSLTFKPGDFRVDTHQSLGTLAVLLLEPQSPDSYFQWGYLSEILQPTEYFEAYAMEPLARRMLEQDPELRARFEEKLLQDAEFAGNPRTRLHWFYQQTPYYDQTYRVYPVYRQMAP